MIVLMVLHIGTHTIYKLQGKNAKEELYLSFEDALTLADEDIDANWEEYKSKFLEGGII